MYSKILILRFPKNVVHKPIVCNLVRNYDLNFNILNARVFPRKEGVLVLELYGTKINFKEGLKYLKDNGVHVKNAEQEVSRDIKKCTHCGACTAVCPTAALSIKRPEMSVDFDQKKCSVCEICISTCPVRAMKVRRTWYRKSVKTHE